MYLGVHVEMICVKSLHLRLNRFLLLIIGLWPYQQCKLVRLQWTLLSIILTSFIAFQCATFITSNCSVQIVIEVLSNVFYFSAQAIMYNCFYFNMDGVMHLLEILQHTYNELKDNHEIAIIEKYGIIAQRYTSIFTLILIGLSPAFLIFVFWPCILDIILPLNKPRPHPPLYIMTEYFVDKGKYFYLIALHMTISCGIGIMTILATGTLSLACLQYACGMFQIASYRMRQVMRINTVTMRNNGYKNLICKKIIYAVDIHRKAMKLVFIECCRYNKYRL